MSEFLLGGVLFFVHYNGKYFSCVQNPLSYKYTSLVYTFLEQRKGVAETKKRLNHELMLLYRGILPSKEEKHAPPTRDELLASASGNYASRLAAPTCIHPVGRASAVKTTASVSPDDGNGQEEARLPATDVRDEEEEEEGEKHEDEDKDAQESDYYAMSAAVRRTIKQVMRPGCKLYSRSTVSRSLVKPSPRTYPHLPLPPQLAQSDVCHRPPAPIIRRLLSRSEAEDWQRGSRLCFFQTNLRSRNQEPACCPSSNRLSTHTPGTSSTHQRVCHPNHHARCMGGRQ